MVPFNKLAKGARFKYPDSDTIWVVLESYGMGLIVEYHGYINDNWASHCSFVGGSWDLKSEVEVIS